MMIEFDTPIEVTKEQYEFCMKAFSGAIAGRSEDNKYWIKVWYMSVVPYIKKYLEQNETIDFDNSQCEL